MLLEKLSGLRVGSPLVKLCVVDLEATSGCEDLSSQKYGTVMPCSSSVLSSGAVTAVAAAQGRSEKKP